MKKYIVLILVLALTLTSNAQFQDQKFVANMQAKFPDIPKEYFRNAMPVLKEGFYSRYNAYGDGVKAGKGSSKFVDNERFGKVIEIETHDVFTNDWDVEIGGPSDYTCLQYDVVYISFWIRCLKSVDESNQGYTRVYFQENGPPWRKPCDVNVVAGSEWVQYRIPFRVKYRHFKEGTAAVAFALGYRHQTVQIADVQVINFGTQVSHKDLPGTKFTYPTRNDKDAAWRKIAADNIEKYRKGDMKVIVKDATGGLISDAEVKVDMQKHEFGFGNIVNRPQFGGGSKNSEMYRKIVKENFNQVTFENAFKHDMWVQYKNEGTTDRIFQAIDSLESWNIDLRGHAMVWPATRYTTICKPCIELDPDTAAVIKCLEKTINPSIKERGEAARGHVVDWDVMNEPYVNHKFMDYMGNKAVIDWFNQTRQYDPNAKLFINETRFIIDGGVNSNVQDNLFEWATYLKENKVDIGGLGFQGHFNETGLTSPDKLQEIFDRFAKLDLTLKITELDIQTMDWELQADYMRDFYTVVFGHPSFEGIISWGFWEKSHWRPECAWWDKNWNIKPVGLVHQDLVFKQWWTNEAGVTGKDGTFKVRGFEGDYKITVTKNGKETIQEAHLSNDGKTVEIIIQ